MNVEIYGTSWCTFCTQAKQLCEDLSIDYAYVDVDDTPKLRQLEERIGEKVKSIPQVFIDGKFIPGGFSALQKQLADFNNETR